MQHHADRGAGSFLAGAILGTILASILAIPFYGLAPLLVVLGIIIVLAVVSRVGGA